MFLFVIFGFCLLFGWILFLAGSLSSPGVPILRHMYLWRYICLTQGIHLLYSRNKLTLRHKIESTKVLLKFQWIFVILLRLFAIRNFRDTSSPAELLKGYMVRERLGTAALLRIYFSWVRTHCSVYIINSLLAANSMCSWVSYLFDCKPRLMKIFYHFMRLTIKGGLHFSFLYFIERYIDDAQSFLGYVL